MNQRSGRHKFCQITRIVKFEPLSGAVNLTSLWNSIAPIVLNLLRERGTTVAGVNCSDILDEKLKSTFR
jgi:hypothetical protein